MPGLLTPSGDSSSIVPYSPDTNTPTLYTLHHGLNSPISPRLSVSWSHGNSLRVTVFRPPEINTSTDGESGGKVLELKLSGEDVDSETNDAARWRRIVYGSVAPFAHLQNKKNAMAALAELRQSVSIDGEW